MTNKSRQQGFNLIELMFVLAIAAVLLTIGIPSLNTTLDRRGLASEADRLARSFQFARSYAVDRQVTVAVSSINNATNWSNGWVVYTPANNNPSTPWPGGDTFIRRVDPAGRPINLNANVARIVFDPSGRLVTGSTALDISVCDTAQNPGFDGEQVSVSLIGRTSVSTIAGANKADEC